MKKIILILMVLMLILTGIGCGDKEAESQNTPEDLVKEAEQTKEEVEAAIDALGKGASVRGETLTLEEFARLSDLLSPYKKG